MSREPEVLKNISDLNDSEQEALVLNILRRVKQRRYGDITISISGGRITKAWEIVKHDTRHMPLKEATI